MAMAFRRTKGLEFQSHTGRELEIQTTNGIFQCVWHLLFNRVGILILIRHDVLSRSTSFFEIRYMNCEKEHCRPRYPLILVDSD